MKFSVGCVSLALLLAFIPHGTNAASLRVAPCSDKSVRFVSSRSHALANPCVAKAHRFVIETNYYQNASLVGGTALAAFPETRVRYGVANRTELFLDGPSEIAKSGLHGRGIYYMVPVGLGVKYEFLRTRGVTYSLSAENRPPLQPLANQSLIPLSDGHVSANWSGAGQREYGVELGVLSFEAARRHSNHRVSTMAAFSVTQPLNDRTSLTAEISEQTHAIMGGGPQTGAILSLQRMMSSHVTFNIEGGTAFNATANSKPHYWGFGFVLH
jgi:hypothetical protein